jgi:hypothetical protein
MSPSRWALVVRRSARLHRARLLLTLGGGLLLCALAVWLGEHRTGDPGLLFSSVDPRRVAQGVMTLASALCLAMTGGLLLGVSRLLARTADERARGQSSAWLCAALLAVGVGADSLLWLHERLGLYLVRHGWPRLPGGLDPKVYVVAAYALAALLLARWLWPSLLWFRTTVSLLAAAVLFLGVSEILDVFSPAPRRDVETVEEALKFLGTAFAVVFAQALLEATATASSRAFLRRRRADKRGRRGGRPREACDAVQ